MTLPPAASRSFQTWFIKVGGGIAGRPDFDPAHEPLSRPSRGHVPTSLGEKIVIRVHESFTDTLGFDHLGMTGLQGTKIGELTAAPYGRDPRGRSTGAGRPPRFTVAWERPTCPRNVMTIEDPIEYRPGANWDPGRRQGRHGLSEGLKAMLRCGTRTSSDRRRSATTRPLASASAPPYPACSSSPRSTRETRLELSETYNFGIPGYQLSSSSLAIASRRLIRKICPYCRVSYAADPKVIAILGLNPTNTPS